MNKKPTGLFCSMALAFVLLLSLAGCMSRQAGPVVSVLHNGLLIKATMFAKKPDEIKVLGSVRVVNKTSRRHSFSAVQLVMRNNVDRFPTRRVFPLAFLKDNSPIEIAPGDSLQLKVFWYTGTAFDTAGLSLEYNDFASAGNVRIVGNPLKASVEDSLKKASGSR
jgi:hypothetical protein